MSSYDEEPDGCATAVIVVIVLVVIIVGLIAAFHFTRPDASAQVDPDKARTAEEIAALQTTDLDQDGFCVHEKSCTDASKKPGDCKDEDATVNPGAPEGQQINGAIWGDGIDNNCNGQVDEGAVNVDQDGDGFCAGISCLNGKKPGDCNDADALAFPGADEQRSGTDDDCNGVIDNGTVWHDDDEDGYCEHTTCLPADVKPRDCNDDQASVYPSAPEGERVGDILLPDHIDNNCDGNIDEGTTSRGRDQDGDGWCSESPCLTDLPSGDCDDGNPSVHPNAPEGERLTQGKEDLFTGDGLDNDCDGFVDEGTLSGDVDGDGHTLEGGDCDEFNPLVYPTAPEWQDGLDNNCDGTVDGEDELAPLTSVPTDVLTQMRGTLFELYPLDLFRARQDWSFDHDVNMATIDWKTRTLSLEQGKARKGEDLTRDRWQIKRMVGPYLFFTIERKDGKQETIEQVMQIDIRLRSLKLSLLIPDPPRPGILVKSGWPIDGMMARPGLSEHLVVHAPQGVADVTLARDPKETTLFFWRCQEVSCQKGEPEYLGQIQLGNRLPTKLVTGPVTVDVETLDVYDLQSCRRAYKKMEQGIIKEGQTQSVEELFRPTEAACLTRTGTTTLPFQLIFTR